MQSLANALKNAGGDLQENWLVGGYEPFFDEEGFVDPYEVPEPAYFDEFGEPGMPSLVLPVAADTTEVPEFERIEKTVEAIDDVPKQVKLETPYGVQEVPLYEIAPRTEPVPVFEGENYYNPWAVDFIPERDYEESMGVGSTTDSESSVKARVVHKFKKQPKEHKAKQIHKVKNALHKKFLRVKGGSEDTEHKKAKLLKRRKTMLKKKALRKRKAMKARKLAKKRLIAKKRAMIRKIKGARKHKKYASLKKVKYLKKKAKLAKAKKHAMHAKKHRIAKKRAALKKQLKLRLHKQKRARKTKLLAKKKKLMKRRLSKHRKAHLHKKAAKHRALLARVKKARKARALKKRKMHKKRGLKKHHAKRHGRKHLLEELDDDDQDTTNVTFLDDEDEDAEEDLMQVEDSKLPEDADDLQEDDSTDDPTDEIEQMEAEEDASADEE